jgi:hypothetical protein
MPKYIFECTKCHIKKHKYVPTNITATDCPECQGLMSRELPTLSGTAQVTEKIDSYTGVALDQNHKENIKYRREEHYWNVEVPRFVEKYSLETCLENKWLVYNEKGDLVVNKPPHLR